VSKKQGYCNGNAAILENLPIGTYIIPVMNSPKMTGKVNSFTMTVWAEKSSVTIEKKKD